MQRRNLDHKERGPVYPVVVTEELGVARHPHLRQPGPHVADGPAQHGPVSGVPHSPHPSHSS